MMLEISKFSKELLDEIKKDDKEIVIVSHNDTDGITSAAIMIKTLRRLDKAFSLKIVKQLEQEIMEQLPEDKTLIFLDLGSANIDDFEKKKQRVFIIDHHEIRYSNENIPKDIRIINPHLNGEEEICGAGLTYLVSKSMNSDNIDLANLAVIGLIGDMLDQNLNKINQQILKDANVVQKKGLMLYPYTRPIDKVLEFSSGLFIPGITGNSRGVFLMLKEACIEKKDRTYPSLIDLSEEEMSRLTTAIILRNIAKGDSKKLIGNVYLINFFNRLEDVREISAMINACSRLDCSDISIRLCLGEKKSRSIAESIHAEYKQHIISGLNYISGIQRIEGNGFIIINAEDRIKDTIIGTIASILSASSAYEEGTIIITMAYNKEKIKVSARVCGRNGRNVREILDSVVKKIGGESGGHALAAGCLISKEREKEFVDSLKGKLEVEVVKV
jgi:RecJ-like exonuclease